MKNGVGSFFRGQRLLQILVTSALRRERTVRVPCPRHEDCGILVKRVIVRCYNFGARRH